MADASKVHRVYSTECIGKDCNSSCRRKDSSRRRTRGRGRSSGWKDSGSQSHTVAGTTGVGLGLLLEMECFRGESTLKTLARLGWQVFVKADDGKSDLHPESDSSQSGDAAAGTTEADLGHAWKDKKRRCY